MRYKTGIFALSVSFFGTLRHARDHQSCWFVLCGRTERKPWSVLNNLLALSHVCFHTDGDRKCTAVNFSPQHIGLLGQRSQWAPVPVFVCLQCQILPSVVSFSQSVRPCSSCYAAIFFFLSSPFLHKGWTVAPFFPSLLAV